MAPPEDVEEAGQRAPVEVGGRVGPIVDHVAAGVDVRHRPGQSRLAQPVAAEAEVDEVDVEPAAELRLVGHAGVGSGVTLQVMLEDP